MKTKLLALVIILLGMSFYSPAQTFTNNQKSIGSPGIDMDKAILVHDTTGFLIIGVVDTTGNHQRVWLININSNGDTVWTKIFDSHLPGGLVGFDVEYTSDNGIAIAATVQGYRGSYQDALAIKTDINGNF